MQTVVITGETLTLDELVAVCRFDAFVELDKVGSGTHPCIQKNH